MNRDRCQGFTLVELLVVLIILGLTLGLVAPRLVGTYEALKAAAEEQKLFDVIEAIKMRAFLRGVPYTVDFEGDKLRIRTADEAMAFEFIRFPESVITVNANGFSDSGFVVYYIGGKEKRINVLQ